MGYVRYFLKRGLYYLTLPFRFIFKLPTHVVSAPRKLFGLSLPMRVAVIVAVFIPLLCLIAILGFLADGYNVPDLAAWKSWGLILTLLLLNIALPICAYYGVTAYLKPEVSDHPDIDKAFDMGMKVLEENNIDVQDVPIILTLGAATRSEVHNVFAGAGFKYIEPKGTPKGDFPLVWYVREEGPDPVIFLSTAGIGCTGHMNALAAGLTGMADPDDVGPRGTVLAGASEEEGPRGTVVSAPPSSDDLDTPAVTTDAGDSPPTRYQGTIVYGETHVPQPQEPSTKPTSPGYSPLSPADERVESDKLTHILGRIGRLRQPFCWFNGIVMLMPWKALNNEQAVHYLSEAIRSDLITTQAAAKIRVPVAALINGVERDRGFIDLVHQVGYETARASRFGKGLPNEVLCDEEVMMSLADQSCSAFESCIYDLFRREKALTANLSNNRLYLLLGRVRSRIRHRVRRLLSQGMGYKKGDQLVPIPVAGCYFAATGATNDQRAFIGSVLEKLIRLEQEIEWTPSMIRQDKTHQATAQTFMLLSGLLFTALVGAFIWLAFRG